MTHGAQIIDDFRAAVAGVSQDRIEDHIEDLQMMDLALIDDNESLLKRVTESPRWMIAGERTNLLCISAQLFKLNFPNDWQEGFELSEKRWQLTPGSLARLLSAWDQVNRRL